MIHLSRRHGSSEPVTRPANAPTSPRYHAGYVTCESLPAPHPETQSLLDPIPAMHSHDRLGALTRADVPTGSNKVGFSGRIGSRALKPGSYEAILSACNAAGCSVPVMLAFKCRWPLSATKLGLQSWSLVITTWLPHGSRT